MALAVVAGLGLVPLTATAQDLQDVREQRAQLEQRLQDTQRELEELQARIAARQREIEDLAVRSDELLAQLRETEASLEVRARSAFKRGGLATLQALMTGEGPSAAIERAATLESLARRDDASIESASALRIQLRQAERLRRDALADLEDLQEQVDQHIAELGDDLADVKILERDLELKAKRQRMVERGPQQGIYSCPMARPFSFIDSWGFPRSGGRRHKGVDIMAPYGTEIYAFHAGRITRLANSGLGGISLYLWGDDGNEYFYTHLAGYADGVRVGMRVEAGDPIAYNGDTGNARGTPHLHWEVHPGGGAAVNPYPWAAAACY